MQDVTAAPPKARSPVGLVIQAWMLTLVCPGLGQIRLGARLRGMLTLAVVVGSLTWMGVAYVMPVREFVAQKAALSTDVPDFGTMMSWVNDPGLWKRLHDVSTLPAWLFFFSFVYSFVDSAYLAFNQKQ